MLLEVVKREQRTSVVILGSERDVDFSLFKPRGHYVKSDKLKRFFRAMSWLGTVDFRIDGSAPGDEAAQVQDRYQLQCACMAIHVLRKANAFEALRTFHETISALAGDGVGADSMAPMQLDTLIGQRDILRTYFGDMAIENLASLQEEIANQGFGAQAIMGHPFMEASSTKPTRSPTAFAFMGQQFVWSAFVFSKLVFDQVSHQGIKIPRRMTSGVDVAFALFGNDIATSEITKRMTASPGGDSDFVEFRDGLPYTANLIATRQVIEDHLAKVDPEKTSIAMLWQLALRELSKSSASQDKVFTSDVWQKRLMNTQLASFTQLRHDTILYAKQSSGAMTCCEYPAGYVDPYPSFWVKMKELSQRMLAIVETIQIMKGITTEENESYMQRKARICFQNFVNVTDQLVKISMAQAQHQDLTEEQVHFLKTVMEERHGSGGTRYLGWYPSLFYVEREQSGKRDHLVADVHTDPPSLEHGDVGGVLHVGVGDVNLAMVVAGNTLYAGPVFSHYELVMPFNERLTDTEFSARLPSLQAPQWARESFLVTN